MTLRRQTQASPPLFTDVVLKGATARFEPQNSPPDVRQGDEQVLILNDEITAAGWPGPPRARDSLTDDGKVWAVQGARSVYDGGTLVGHYLWVRG